MSLVDKPCIGVVYKTDRGITYTEWYHQQAFNYPQPTAEQWLDDKLWWNRKIGNFFNGTKTMCVVRAK